ncbi:MAG: tetratricopeptide repeat protein [Vicingaceae bacterium]
MQKSLLGIVLLLFLWACGSSEKVTTTPEKVQLSEKDEVNFGRAYMDGVKAKVLGNFEEAEGHFKAALKILPTHAAANYELGLVYNAQEQKDLAFQQFKLATQAEPNNYWYKLSYASFLDDRNDKTEAIKVFKELVEIKPAQIELKYELSKLLLEQNKPKESISYLNQIEEEIGVTEEISYLKQRIFLSQNDVEGAASEIKELIEAFPNEMKYYGVLADIYLSNGKDDKAMSVYKQMEAKDPDDYRVQFSMAEYYRKEGKKEKYLTAIKKAFANPEMKIDDKVKYVLTFYQVNSKDQEKKAEGIKLCETIVEAHPENAKSHALLADFLYFDDQNDRAKEEYIKTIALDSSRFPVWNQLLVLQSETNDLKGLLNYGERAVTLFPNQPTVYLLYGLGLAQDGQHEEAIDYLSMGKDLVIDNDGLKGQIYSSIGDSYHALEQDEKSDENYEKALEIDPNNVYVLNNYSYYLSERKIELEKAKKMSQRSNQLAPGQSSFQDTYAWILYQLGEYEEANTWIDKALKSDGGNSPVLLEHKGDILFQLGQKKEAIEYWIKAKEKGSESGELEQKIKDNKPDEN